MSSIGNKILLSVNNLKTNKIKLITADDTEIPPNCETIFTIAIVTPGGVDSCLVEQRHESQNNCEVSSRRERENRSSKDGKY